MGLEEYIPFEEKKFRPYQEEAIKDVIESIEGGNKYTILNASVGSGKSVIAYVVAKYFQEQDYDSYLSTSTKILQQQYIDDFTDVKTIKGRGNFDCATEPLVKCSNGMCKSGSKFKCDFKPILKDKWEFNGLDLDSSIFHKNVMETDMCQYWFQKLDGIFNPITMLNYDYLISDTRFVRQLPFRKLLVCDEAHQLESVLMRQLELSFSPKAVENDTGFKFNLNNTIKQWADDLLILSDIYKEKKKSAKSDKKRLRYEERVEQFASLSYMMDKDPENWVFSLETFGSNQRIFTFKPIQISEYTSYIFNVAEHIVLMTGTILKQDIFARDLGISDFEYIEVPSIIPPSNRPIVKSYVGSMSRSSIESTMPNMIAKVKMLAEKHLDEKGIIHTFTYNIANRFRNAFKHDDRFLFHNQGNKDIIFDMFKKDDTNKILVSPVAFEGVDFPYDQGRWQCICKDPFPNIGDPQIIEREKIDFEWVFRQRCLVLSQMYGRTNRATDDFSITYLLDSRLESLLGPASLVTDYFYEALEGVHYNDILVLNENAYEKLTKDTARKNHEFDRVVEKNVLNDIESGYNTLSKLRKEYKKFPSDSYKYITPAVERLLKHGAIRYA